jgi:putative ABC transport system permease protein
LGTYQGVRLYPVSQPPKIGCPILRPGLGLLIGIPAAVAAGHLMAGELYGIKEWDLLVLGTTTAVLGVVALLAAALPARRAAGVEPMEALRGE